MYGVTAMENWKESQLRQISNARDVESAYATSLGLVQNLGFDFCAFSITSPPRGPHFKRVSLNNYPSDWIAKYEEGQFSEVDPVLAHCMHSSLPILWGRQGLREKPKAVASAKKARPGTWLVTLAA
jgi:LuxR family transcriptional regulator